MNKNERNGQLSWPAQRLEDIGFDIRRALRRQNTSKVLLIVKRLAILLVQQV